MTGNKVTVNIEGTVDVINEIDQNYSMTTSDGNDAICDLKKNKNDYYSNLNCEVTNPGKNFKLNKDGVDDKGNSLFFTTEGSEETINLCKNIVTGVKGNKDSSGGKLSGGAIAGIVIACVVVVIIFGAVVAFIWKREDLSRGAVADTSAYSKATAVSSSNEAVGKK